MPKKTMDILTESMFYVLMALEKSPMCGIEIASTIDTLTENRVNIGPATLYTVLGRFEKEGSRMKGRATVQLDDCFVVRDIRIIDGDNGLFIAMPSKKVPGGHKDIAHPINRETRKMFEDAILEAYENAEVEEVANDEE